MVSGVDNRSHLVPYNATVASQIITDHSDWRTGISSAGNIKTITTKTANQRRIDTGNGT